MGLNPFDTKIIRFVERGVKALESIATSLSTGDVTTVYADNKPYLTVIESGKNNEGTLQLVRDILSDQGADQYITTAIIRELEDAGIVFVEVPKNE